jgi:hypothetical protein
LRRSKTTPPRARAMTTGAQTHFDLLDVRLSDMVLEAELENDNDDDSDALSEELGELEQAALTAPRRTPGKLPMLDHEPLDAAAKTALPELEGGLHNAASAVP